MSGRSTSSAPIALPDLGQFVMGSVGVVLCTSVRERSEEGVAGAFDSIPSDLLPINSHT